MLYAHIFVICNLLSTVATAQGRALHASIGDQGYRQPSVWQEACSRPVHSPLAE